MGGTIWAESAPGRGTSFHFTARFGIGQPPEPQRAPLPPAAGALRVLVVEDQPDARAALEATLRTLGIGSAADGAIDSAVDGANALAKVAAACDRHPYDVLLLDWVLPDMDGGAVLARLAQLGQQVPFTAVVSAYDTEAIDAVAAPLGVHHFLPKPVLPGALRYLISTALGGAEALPTPQHAWRGYDLSGMRVLLVEDNRINQQVASELIEMRGVEVVLANDGRQALDILAGHAPQYFDLVLMDLQMPLMDGYEATRQLRLQERYARLPIVAMTAHAMAEERERCDALGMNGHVSKPIEPEQLYAMLAQHYGAQAAAASAALAPKEVAHPASGPAIAGIDSVAGLRRAGGKISLYLRLLSHFAADYRAAGHQLAAWLDSAEWDQAERLAHTLKGVAATIGADALAPLAGALETACHQQQLDTARQALAALQPVLAQQCAALDQHFAEPAPLASHADKPGGPAPAWLPRLRKMLDECDSEALLLWEGGHAEAAAWLNATQIGRINRALDNFEFDKALALLPPDAGSN
jgi:CheY-like chemotaxis protein/HPt (histidine-containing phosphotransfer) domain-containing protein